MMRLWAACRNTSVRRTTGTAPDAMMSASTWPGPTDGSWSMSPTIKSAARSGTAFVSDCISDHGGFVNHEQIAVERVVVAALKASTFRVDLQQPMDRLASK